MDEKIEKWMDFGYVDKRLDGRRYRPTDWTEHSKHFDIYKSISISTFCTVTNNRNMYTMYIMAGV